MIEKQTERPKIEKSFYLLVAEVLFLCLLLSGGAIVFIQFASGSPIITQYEGDMHTNADEFGELHSFLDAPEITDLQRGRTIELSASIPEGMKLVSDVFISNTGSLLYALQESGVRSLKGKIYEYRPVEHELRLVLDKEVGLNGVSPSGEYLLYVEHGPDDQNTSVVVSKQNPSEVIFQFPGIAYLHSNGWDIEKYPVFFVRQDLLLGRFIVVDIENQTTIDFPGLHVDVNTTGTTSREPQYIPNQDVLVWADYDSFLPMTSLTQEDHDGHLIVLESGAAIDRVSTSDGAFTLLLFPNVSGPAMDRPVFLVDNLMNEKKKIGTGVRLQLLGTDSVILIKADGTTEIKQLGHIFHPENEQFALGGEVNERQDS